MNVIHGADSVQNSARETALWFSDDDIAQWEPALQKWIVDPALIQWTCVCLVTWTWIQAQGLSSRGGFFSESAMCFSNLQISKKKYSKKTILNLKFKFPTNNSKVLLAGNLNFKLRIVFWNIFFWDLEIWKMNRTFWKKPPLTVKQNAWNLLLKVSLNRVAFGTNNWEYRNKLENSSFFLLHSACILKTC